MVKNKQKQNIEVKGLVSKLCKGLLAISSTTNKKRIYYQIENWVKVLKRAIPLLNIYYSNSIVVKEISLYTNRLSKLKDRLIPILVEFRKKSSEINC